jgi:hypothetical protein
MNDNSYSNSTLVEAKNQYMIQLIEILSPSLYVGFRLIFSTCKQSNNVLKKFQEKLCLISKWNQDIIDSEYDRVLKVTKCDWLDKLLETIFICNVKILTTINSDASNTFNIKVPETKNFIHKCYIETARQLYTEPYILDDREHICSVETINKNIKICMDVIGKCIEKTVHSFIPKQEILEKCLMEYTSDNNDESGNEDDNDENEYIENPEDNQNEENHEEENEDDDNPLLGLSDEENNDKTEELEEKKNEIFMQEPKPVLDVIEGETLENINKEPDTSDVKTVSMQPDYKEDIDFFSDED